MSSFFDWLTRSLPLLGRHQARSPRPYIIGSLLLIAASVPLILKLQLNGDLTALLPSWMESVRDMKEIGRRFGQPLTLGVLIESPDEKNNQAFVRALAPRLDRLKQYGVSSADWTLGDYTRLAEKNKFLFVPLADLTRLRDLLRERIEREKAKANPLMVDLGPPDHALEDEIDKLHPKSKGEQPSARYRDGFFSSSPRFYGIFVRTDIQGGQMGRIEALTAAIGREVEAVRKELHLERQGTDKDLLVDLGGGVMDMYAEQKALQDAALLATLLTLGLVALALLVFYRRWTAIPIMLLGIVTPITVTFGAAYFLIDYINASSAFLIAIVIGNGINPHCIWMARFFEERRAGRTIEEAVAESHRTTWPGTLSASLGAALAYSALVVTDFRAFRDFGLIGGLGMVLCWVATFLCTPVLAALFERRFPTQPAPADHGNLYGRATAFLAFGAPRLVLLGAGALTVVSAVYITRWAAELPIEYDFRKLQSERKDSHLAQVSDHLAGCADASAAGNGIAVLARTPADLPTVRATMEEYGRQHPGVVGSIHDIGMLLPTDQDRKIPVLGDLRRLMLEARPHLTPQQQKELDEFLPPEHIKPVEASELPEMVARPFTELDGTRGTILYVEQFSGANQFDGKYITDWTRGVRAARNRDGTRAAVAGLAPVIADLVEAITHSGPRTVAASFVATLVLLFFTFFRTRDRVFTFGSHLMGVAWMVGLMAALQVKVNFLNFIALPVAFGLGIDYGVNVMRRFVEEEEGGRTPIEAIRAAVNQTGGAVILCSLTTLIGYLSLFTSPNQAVNSFGKAMSIAEVTGLVSAVLVLPAALLVVMRGRRGAAPPADAEKARTAA